MTGTVEVIEAAAVGRAQPLGDGIGGSGVGPGLSPLRDGAAASDGMTVEEGAVAVEQPSGSAGDSPGAAVAFILAGGILAAMAAFVFGMIRFGKAAAHQ